MKSAPTTVEPDVDEDVEMVLTRHQGDARAAIKTLLTDCRHLRGAAADHGNSDEFRLLSPLASELYLTARNTFVPIGVRIRHSFHSTFNLVPCS